jgi:Rha family phage regulatory protein
MSRRTSSVYGVNKNSSKESEPEVVYAVNNEGPEPSLAMESNTSLEPAISHEDGRVWTTSLAVAEHFGKLHFHVLRDIKAIESDAPVEWCASNFGFTYREVPGPNGGVRPEPYYRISRDGFAILAMGFTGKRALLWKIAYIEAFNQMEQELTRCHPAAAPTTADALRLDACLYTRLLYALGHKRSWAMLAWCLLSMGAHQAPVRATYRGLMHAMGNALTVGGVWLAMQALRKQGLVNDDSAGFQLDRAALASLLRAVPDLADMRPGLLQDPPLLVLPEANLPQLPVRPK